MSYFNLFPTILPGNLVINGNLTVNGTTTLVGAATTGQVIIDIDNDEALIVRKDGDAGDIFIVDTTNSNVMLPDDIPLQLGTSGDGQILWETADANANAFLVALPSGGAVDVPVMIIGNKTAPTVINVDLGLFNGITAPTLAILDTTNADYLSFSHDGTDSHISSNTGFIEFNAGSNNIRLLDDNGFIYGNSNDVTMIFETADANANAMLLALPEGAGANVPVFVLGNKTAPSVVNADLGFFNGTTDPTLALISTDNTKYGYLQADGTDFLILASSGTTKVQRTSTADEDLIALTADVQSTGATGNDNSLISVKSTGTFNYAGNTLANFYMLYAAQPARPFGIINNIYGLYIENIDNASTTNNAIRTMGGSSQFFLNAGNTFTIDADTTDHTGANAFLVDLGVNSASVNAIGVQTRVGTALSSTEIVNGLSININGNAGDAADSEMHGIYLTSANTTGSTRNYAMDIDGTWDYMFHAGTGPFSFATGDAVSDTEVRIVSPTSGDPKLTLYQTTSERLRIQYLDAGDTAEIDSDGPLKLYTNNALAIALSGSGRFTHTPAITTSSASAVFEVTDAAHTGITAATEKNAVDFDCSSTKTWAAGAGPLATQREFLIQAPTYAGDAGGALTITAASTLYIDNAPQAGANMTLSNAYSLFVDAGLARFDGNGTDVFELPADATDPTGGGGAATGRVPVRIGGATVYLPYY